MKNVLDCLDEAGINYDEDIKPSPKKLEMLNKSIEVRNNRIKELQEWFTNGGLRCYYKSYKK